MLKIFFNVYSFKRITPPSSLRANCIHVFLLSVLTVHNASCRAYLSKYFYTTNALDLSHMRSITNKKSAIAFIGLKMIHCVIKCKTLTEALFIKGACHSLIDKKFSDNHTRILR